ETTCPTGKRGRQFNLSSYAHSDDYADANHSDQGECEPQPVTPDQARLKLPASCFQLRSFVLEVSLGLLPGQRALFQLVLNVAGSRLGVQQLAAHVRDRFPGRLGVRRN